jgi:hypothetical protein
LPHAWADLPQPATPEHDPLGIYGLALVLRAQGKFGDAIPYVQRENFQGGFDLAATYVAAGPTAEERRQLTDCVLPLQQQKRYVRPCWGDKRATG